MITELNGGIFIMKKSILASSLAVALGVTGYSLATDGNEAQASEQNVDYAHLADLAQNHPSELNAAPIQEGAYDIHFVYNGNAYNFTSDGHSWEWQWYYVGSASNDVADVSTAASTVSYENTAADVQSQQQSSNYNVEAVSAPTQTESTSSYTSSRNYSTTQTAAPATRSYSVAQTSAPASTGGSVKSQFLAAGGNEAMWNAIVLPESGGNPNAVNPAGYRGLGQTMESWGTGSVANQTKGMLNYAQQRYGSVDAAIAFRANHGWW